MTLFVCAQDLGFFWIGLVENDGFMALQKKEVPPESYLVSLQEFFNEFHVDKDCLDRVCVVTGPGSFTCSRVSLTIVNTLRFTKKMSLFTLENPDFLSPEVLLKEKGLGEEVLPDLYARPFYNRPAHITSARGDKPLAV